ncbi:cellulase family glycosylhydrolase [uncultured Eubacterium sp.]|uniref:cellulase family glycosylhydrolase n=1 Tax=uncultured Eubacterium sp. TaxID=165185 RepID=UPI00267107D3|nr:cellulase family glycosylhydrolase [uncultured Eubacterium sp.]
MSKIKKIGVWLLVAALSLTSIPFGKTMHVKAASTTEVKYVNFLKADGKQLKNTSGDTVYLRGVNAGGYMLQEIWLCATKGTTDDNKSGNIRCQQDILNTLTNRFGKEKTRTLIDTYEKNYWTYKDFENCAKLGINCIRLPIWYRNLVDENGNWYNNAFERMDWFIEQAGRYGIYVIIDMHGTYGSQNGSHNSGMHGGETNQQKKDNSKLFFGSDAGTNQAKYLDMWSKIAEHYKGNPVVAGYDLLNEPMADYMNATDVDGNKQDRLNSLWDVYDKAYKRIRTVDKEHVIIMEAVWDPDTLPNPGDKNWQNVMYEYHQYLYADYDNKEKQIAAMQNKINAIDSAGYNVPSYIGEFNYMSNSDTWGDGIKLLNDNNLNWTTWNYKCTAEYGNWGLYNTPGNGSDNDTNNYWADVENDSYDTILNKWSRADESTKNAGVADKIKQYMPGTIDGLKTAVVKEVSDVKATGMLNSIDVTWYPKANMDSSTQYHIYVDNATVPAMTVAQSAIQTNSVSKEALKYSNQQGIVNDPANIGGTHNGDWVEYNDISLPTPATSLTINYSCEQNKGGLIYIYDGNMDGSPIGAITIQPPKSGATWNDYVTKTIDLFEPLVAGKHTIYLKFLRYDSDSSNVANVRDFTFLCPTAMAALTNVSAGKHTVTVQAVRGTDVSPEKLSKEVEVVSTASVLTSDRISIKGFQIKTNGTRYYNAQGEVVFDEEGNEKVAFRTICQAPSVGETLTIAGKTYKVKNIGTIYTIDPNATGIPEKDVFDSSYSILNTEPVEGKGYEYSGAKQYNGYDYTLGYLATDDGILSNKDGYTEYVRTMRNNSYYGSDGSLKVMTNSFHARAFVVAEDGTIIYGTDTASMSIPEVASYVYKNVLSTNYNGHAYLYDTILHRVDSSNPYYQTLKVDYGWNENLYDPENK